MTLQEMFDKAYLGLASQGFERCTDHLGACSYAVFDKNGGVRHCAWGWVDESLTPDQGGTVAGLYSRGIGLAANLDCFTLLFAEELQGAHDTARSPSGVHLNLMTLAEKYSLTVPRTA